MNTQIAPIIIGKTEITPIFYQEQAVITLAMMDKVHSRAEGTARRNFNENHNRLVEGEDYFRLSKYDMESMDEFRTSANPKGILLFTESGYLLLVKSFTDELAWQIQRQLVKAYFAVKLQTSQFPIPQTLSEALMLAGQLAAEKEAALSKIEVDKPKVKFADIVTDCSNTRCIRVWVKAMKSENNLTVGEQEVFKWLVKNGYIFKHDKGYLPKSRYEANGLNYFTVVIDEINGKPRRQLKITGKGVVALTGKVVAAFSKNKQLVV